ncbi:hypothetical protein POTOM_061973 [Populus tomentosa]|uniref:Retrovirus-related Pol polyprotein from transposon TNT 1-94-like beta-barrel domain-containing protein n=1 Tax=Populus tomentosa TaxID=118781 RepID=A0A8X7XPW5_POPTO|nr:hypothetical protein POTOM_061973 [Populus tomentosa]
MQLRLELQSIKKGSLSMIDYIMKVKGAADSLADIGEPVFEQDQVMNLLARLNSDYNVVVTTINLRDDKILVEAIHNDNWYIDSRVSHHLTRNMENLTNSIPYTRTYKVIVGNGKHSSISNTGSHRLVSNSRSFQFRKLFHVPFISANLISVAKFCLDNNALIEFLSNSFLVKNLHTKKILARGRLENGLYKFPALNKKKMAYVGIKHFSVFHSPSSRTTYNKMDIWPYKLGHAATNVVIQILQSYNVSYERIKLLVAQLYVLPINLQRFTDCPLVSPSLMPPNHCN